MDLFKHAIAMTEDNNCWTESVNLEGDSKSDKMITGLDCNAQHLETTIQHAKNRKETLSSAMDSVMSLMREVEHREKEAEEAVENIGKSSLGVLAKVEELKQAQSTVNGVNQKRAKEVYAERDALAAEMDELQITVAGLLNVGDSSVGFLDEIRKALEIRLISALTKKEEAEQENQKMEVSARKALAHEELQMEKVLQESERLKTEVAKNSKKREFVTQHVDEVNMLSKEITCKCGDVNKLKEKLDHAIVPSDTLSSSQTPCEPQSEIMDSKKCLEESLQEKTSMKKNIVTNNVAPISVPINAAKTNGR